MVVGDYSPPGLPSTLPSEPAVDGIVGPSTATGVVPVVPAGVAAVVRPTTGGVEPVATRDPAAGREAVLCLGGDDADLVVIGDIYHCRRVDPHLSCMNVVVLAVDGPD